MIYKEMLHGFGGHVYSTWALDTNRGVLGACLPRTEQEQSKNSPRTATVFEQSNTIEVAYMIYYNLERICYIVLEVTMTRHGPWRHVRKCWVHACP
jgi:hypothetical protein